VAAGAVGADIHALLAQAQLPLGRVLAPCQAQPENLVQQSLVNAFSRRHPGCQGRLGATLDLQSRPGGNEGKTRKHLRLLIPGAGGGVGVESLPVQPPQRLGIRIEAADNHPRGMGGQQARQPGKILRMIPWTHHRGEDHRIIAPDDAAPTDPPGKLLHEKNGLGNGWNGRLQGARVAGNCDQKVKWVSAALDLGQMLQERSRVAAPEDKGVDVLLFQADAPGPVRAKGVFYLDPAAAQLFHEPSAGEGGDIAAPRYADDHSRTAPPGLLSGCGRPA